MCNLVLLVKKIILVAFQTMRESFVVVHSLTTFHPRFTTIYFLLYALYCIDLPTLYFLSDINKQFLQRPSNQGNV